MPGKKRPAVRRFGIVASDPLRFLGLKLMFPERPGFEVVPVDWRGAQSIKHLSLVIIDATSTELLFDLVASLRKAQPSICLVVVGTERDPEYVERVIGAGVKGYLTHGSQEAEIRMAIDIVLDGSIWAPRKVLARLIDKGMLEQGRNAPRPLLTKREKDVLRLLVQGSPNKEIGTALDIDASAVKAHVGRLMRKVGVTNRTALSVEATKNQWLE